MSRNIVAVYDDKANLLDRFNRKLRPTIPKELDMGRGIEFSYFDSSELGYPVVMGDDLARKWLEVNYLFSTGFRPNARYGVGEIGADIRTDQSHLQRYLTVHVGLLDGVVTALNDFRAVEGIYAEWLENQRRYIAEILDLKKGFMHYRILIRQKKNFKG